MTTIAEAAMPPSWRHGAGNLVIYAGGLAWLVSFTGACRILIGGPLV